VLLVVRNVEFSFPAALPCLRRLKNPVSEIASCSLICFSRIFYMFVSLKTYL
jgi:hypothetical protein